MKVIIGNCEERNIWNVDGNRTIREITSDPFYAYPGRLLIEGSFATEEDLDKPLNELTDCDKIYLIYTLKAGVSPFRDEHGIWQTCDVDAGTGRPPEYILRRLHRRGDGVNG